MTQRLKYLMDFTVDTVKLAKFMDFEAKNSGLISKKVPKFNFLKTEFQQAITTRIYFISKHVQKCPATDQADPLHELDAYILSRAEP